jgi:pimeloyl-ACP methyl ester carboxylesterase
MTTPESPAKNINLNTKKMKILKKVLKITGISLAVLLLACSVYIYSSGPKLPKGTEALIDSVIRAPLPELLSPHTGYAHSQGLKIWYESFESSLPSKGVVLLVMGISNDAMGWPESFIKPFVDSGYRVILYDNRGTGLSDWVENWDSKHPYSLADMADDGYAVMAANGLQKAHVVGISMGGMVAQELALRHPKAVMSLTSIMSSGNITDSTLPPISGTTAFNLVKVALKYGIFHTESNTIKLQIASQLILRGNAQYLLNEKEIATRVLYNLRKRRGYNPSVSQQQQYAVLTSGSRYAGLSRLNIPTLIIHGKQDPFIPIQHGRKCAQVIPGAKSLWLDNMGHDLTDNLADTITRSIMNNFKR